MTHLDPLPLVTIVTPTIDTSHYIDEAIGTAQSQGDHAVEHIVVHDGSAAFVDRLAGKFPALRFIKGEGRGATAAVALGIQAAKGKFVLLLNSDDRLMPGSISALADANLGRPDIEIWSGGTRIFTYGTDGRETTVRCLDDREATKLAYEHIGRTLPQTHPEFL